MTKIRRARTAALAVLALAAPSCDALLEPAAEVTAAESTLTFVRVAADAPPVDADSVSFWVVRGQAREVQIRYVYHDAAGNPGYAKCLLFRVPADGLDRYPDGRPFAEGDSVLVTVRLPDKSLYRFDFQPAGLRFDAAHPAELEVRYHYLAADVNGDGVVDALDDGVTAGFAWWRQESPGQPWTRVPTTRREDLQEAHAWITGFTRYALASN